MDGYLEAVMLLNSCGQYDARAWARFEETGLPPEAFVGEGAALWRKIGISDRCVAILEKNAANGWVESELARCDRIGVRVMTARDGLYPRSLLDLDDAPLVLYARGDIFSPGTKTMSIVGTRRCSSYATAVARDLARRGAAMKWLVVSGGAKGVDEAAHIGALEAGGRTIAVFGTGIDVFYPADHRSLFERIAAERGMLLTEYPLGATGEAWRFPRRNRIVVALAQRTVVVEAPTKSGAMITARLAGEIGREIWSVPGRIVDERCAGSNMLLVDGAIPLVDIESFFGEGDPQASLFSDDLVEEKKKDRSRDASKLSDAEKTLVALLTSRADKTIDNLAAEAKMSPADVFKIMSMLSVKGFVITSGPGRYRLTD